MIIKENKENRKPSAVILEAGFNRARTHLNEQPCCFITAFRKEYSHNENQERNKNLEKDIKASGLSYLKAIGHYVETDKDGKQQKVKEDTFCVIDNKYHTNDFEKLAIKWCGDYNQEGVLITYPDEIPFGKGDANYRKAITVTGVEYNSNGKVNAEYSNVTMDDISDYFTQICGKDFALVESVQNITETERDIYKPSNAPYIHKLFKNDYPELQ